MLLIDSAYFGASGTGGYVRGPRAEYTTKGGKEAMTRKSAQAREEFKQSREAIKAGRAGYAILPHKKGGHRLVRLGKGRGGNKAVYNVKGQFSSKAKAREHIKNLVAAGSKKAGSKKGATGQRKK